MKQFIALAYLVFLLLYSLVFMTLSYHKREFSLDNDPIRTITATINSVTIALFVISLVSFIAVLSS